MPLTLFIVILAFLPIACAPASPPLNNIQVHPLNPHVVIRAVRRSETRVDSLSRPNPRPIDAPAQPRSQSPGWQISGSGLTTWGGQPIMPLPFAQVTAPGGNSFKLYLLI